jgi:hypothetical protein
MIRPFVVVASAAALLVAACASLSPYGPQVGGSGQGYSEQRIENDRWRVTYRGVGDPGPVSDYALLRAAELTLQNGDEWFEVTQRWIDGRASQGGIRPNVSIGAGSGSYGGYRTSGVGVGLGLNISGDQPTSTVMEIRTGDGPRPDRPEVYDARSVRDSLGMRY